MPKPGIHTRTAIRAHHFMAGAFALAAAAVLIFANKDVALAFVPVLTGVAGWLNGRTRLGPGQVAFNEEE